MALDFATSPMLLRPFGSSQPLLTAFQLTEHVEPAVEPAGQRSPSDWLFE